MQIGDETLAKWESWLSRIHDDVTQLLISRLIYRKTGEIVRANPKINIHSAFYSFLANGFISSCALGVRRQVELRSDSISLMRLLEEISRAPQLLNRERLRKLYLSRGAKAEWAEPDFDRIAGPGALHVDPLKVKEHIDRLSEAGVSVKSFVDRHLAHLDSRPVDTNNIPTFDDLYAALDLIEEIVKSLLLVIRGESWDFLTPVFQYDWSAIFREPWITPP